MLLAVFLKATRIGRHLERRLVNAITGYRRVSAPLSAEFPALWAHITRGLLDISTEDLPMIAPPEQCQYRYAAAGDAMLLEYCNTLNQEVSWAVRF